MEGHETLEPSKKHGGERAKNGRCLAIIWLRILLGIKQGNWACHKPVLRVLLMVRLPPRVYPERGPIIFPLRFHPQFRTIERARSDLFPTIVQRGATETHPERNSFTR